MYIIGVAFTASPTYFLNDVLFLHFTWEFNPHLHLFENKIHTYPSLIETIFTIDLFRASPIHAYFPLFTLFGFYLSLVFEFARDHGILVKPLPIRHNGASTPFFLLSVFSSLLQPSFFPLTGMALTEGQGLLNFLGPPTSCITSGC